MYDVFISHAHEDKEAIARPLADALTKLGYRVWFDEFTLSVGDSLIESIDKGIGKSKYGIVILSESFFSKKWTQYELRSLSLKNIEYPGRLLPIWYKLSKEEVVRHSWHLSDINAIIFDNQPIKEITVKLERKIGEYKYTVKEQDIIKRSKSKTTIPIADRIRGYQLLQSINTDEIIDEKICISTQELIIYPYSNELKEYPFNYWQGNAGEINVISHMAYNFKTGELISTENEITQNDGTRLVSLVRFIISEIAPIRIVCKISTTNLHSRLFSVGTSDLGFKHTKDTQLFKYYFVVPDKKRFRGIKAYADEKECIFIKCAGKLEVEFQKMKIKGGVEETKFNFVNTLIDD